MSRPFKLPDLGEGIHEGEIIAVIVSVGDQVTEGDPILEVETDKAAVEIPSPFTGTVEAIMVKPGDLVEVGDVLMTFGNGEPVEKDTAEKQPDQVKDEASAPSIDRSKEPVPASPATRRLARELGIDLHQVPPSGPEGLVTVADVRSFVEKGKKPKEVPEPAEPTPKAASAPRIAAPPLPDFAKWGPVEEIPVRSIRRATAKKMALAWSQIPHVTTQDVADITKLEEFRSKHKGGIEAKGGKLTLTVFALKAAATALKAYPNFNSTLDMAASRIIIKHYFHLGVAVDTDNGLVVSVIREVDRKSITELAIELNDLVQRTRARKTTLEEMQGSTFTITNIGAAGGGHFSPIINYPEVAILGMGSARLQPVVMKTKGKDQAIVPRLIMPLTLAIDHRALDGADATRFLRLIIDALEDPDELLMTMV
ncbi:MAG TPA: 2-oxo acid dehydrogenase subunit E2 [Desulfobacterales bacterium]|nr:2-oxo acid dehydrogenase subunit E2 [Desulfobacterales bacterium]